MDIARQRLWHGLRSKLAPVTFPTSLHLVHELNEGWGFPDRIEKRVTGEERIGWKPLIRGDAQPLQGFLVFAIEREDTRDVIGEVMVGLVSSHFLHDPRNGRLRFPLLTLQSQQQRF